VADLAADAAGIKMAVKVALAEVLYEYIVKEVDIPELDESNVVVSKFDAFDVSRRRLTAGIKMELQWYIPLTDREADSDSHHSYLLEMAQGCFKEKMWSLGRSISRQYGSDFDVEDASVNDQTWVRLGVDSNILEGAAAGRGWVGILSCFWGIIVGLLLL
jgi:hypothetical protein